MNPANGRIIRNTGLLYLRLIFLTVVNLYAVRVTLDALGDMDYGIYNVVASVVASLSVLTGAMTSASQRFLSFHLGKNDCQNYSHTFTLLLLAFLALSGVVVLVGEILGYFFVEKWLNIPADRIGAAYVVYQFSLLSLVFSLITIPYNSSIVANEKMGAFAAFSVVEGVLKLAIAFALVGFVGDRLELYGVLMAAVSVIVFLMTMQYCQVKFRYCRYVWKWDRRIFTQLSQYTGWNMFGSVSSMLANQGQAVLLNIFFGPVINAAKAIADRLQHVINGFSVNLYMAVSPQIIKSYAAEDYQRALNLVVRTSKMSFLLIFVLSFPLICNMEGLLRLWLEEGVVTSDMIGFSKLMLLYCMILTLEQPITRIIQATGDIKRYQVSVGVLTLSYIPVAALVLWMGGSAVMSLVVLMLIMVLAQMVRVVVAHRQVQLRYDEYLRNVVVPVFRVAIIAVPLYWAVATGQKDMQWPAILISTIASGVMGIGVAVIMGLDRNDRNMVMEMIKNKLGR